MEHLGPIATSDRAGDWPGHPAPPDPALWPESWLLRVGDGSPPTDHVLAALAEASRRIDRYAGPNPKGRGGPRPSAAGLDLVRAIARDSLHAAPQPVDGTWVKYTLAVVAGVVTAAEVDGVALDYARVLSERSRARFLHHQGASLAPSTRGTYRSRLDLVATAVLIVPEARGSRPGLTGADVTVPGAPRDEADLLAWAAGARPASRRRRLLAVLALCLGCGARLGELVGVRGADVTDDDEGVHVVLRDTAGGSRPVTCRAVWEDVLRRAVPREPAHLVIAPDRPVLELASLSSFLVRSTPGAPVGASPARLRNTWLVRHLEAGTPLSVLLPAAGLEGTTSLDELLPFATSDPCPRARLRVSHESP